MHVDRLAWWMRLVIKVSVVIELIVRVDVLESTVCRTCSEYLFFVIYWCDKSFHVSCIVTTDSLFTLQERSFVKERTPQASLSSKDAVLISLDNHQRATR